MNSMHSVSALSRGMGEEHDLPCQSRVHLYMVTVADIRSHFLRVNLRKATDPEEFLAMSSGPVQINWQRYSDIFKLSLCVFSS